VIISPHLENWKYEIYHEQEQLIKLTLIQGAVEGNYTKRSRLAVKSLPAAAVILNLNQSVNNCVMGGCAACLADFFLQFRLQI